jgi:hypothetical protein
MAGEVTGSYRNKILWDKTGPDWGKRGAWDGCGGPQRGVPIGVKFKVGGGEESHISDLRSGHFLPMCYEVCVVGAGGRGMPVTRFICMP